ncbi:MAG: hypothetical protein ACRBCT_02345 [Alphaproteobacteria bacterium]
MKHFLKKSVCAAALLCAVSATPALAQTVTVPVNATISNTVTATATQGMNYGTVVASTDGTNAVTYLLGSDGTLTPGTAGGTSVASQVDATGLQPGLVTITNAADGSTLNVTIDSVVDPTDGSNSFATSLFTYRRNSEITEQSATVGTAFTMTYADNAGAGSTLAIGATLTGAGATTYDDGAYVGSFEVTVAY